MDKFVINIPIFYQNLLDLTARLNLINPFEKDIDVIEELVFNPVNQILFTTFTDSITL